MRYLVIAFGIFMLGMGVGILARPQPFLDIVRRYADRLILRVGAVVVRIVLGVALLMTADQSLFPVTFEVLGWIAIVAGVIAAILPGDKFRRLITWAIDTFSPYYWVSGLGALVLGAFLIYALTGAS